MQLVLLVKVATTVVVVAVGEEMVEEEDAEVVVDAVAMRSLDLICTMQLFESLG